MSEADERGLEPSPATPINKEKDHFLPHSKQSSSQWPIRYCSSGHLLLCILGVIRNIRIQCARKILQWTIMSVRLYVCTYLNRPIHSCQSIRAVHNAYNISYNYAVSIWPLFLCSLHWRSNNEWRLGKDLEGKQSGIFKYKKKHW